MKAEKELKTKLVMVTGFLALYYIFHIKWFSHIAMALALIFLISNRMSAGVLWFWNKLAEVLGWINTRILLSLVYYLFLLPISLLFRLFNKDVLGLKWKNPDSAYVRRNLKYSPGDIENPW